MALWPPMKTSKGHTTHFKHHKLFQENRKETSLQFTYKVRQTPALHKDNYSSTSFTNTCVRNPNRCQKTESIASMHTETCMLLHTHPTYTQKLSYTQTYTFQHTHTPTYTHTRSNGKKE